MRINNLGSKCKYADECPYYNGKEEMVNSSLHVVRNVFCNRGMRGWKNCSRYISLEKIESNSY
ncbi:MAG: hypothetical protein JXB49_23360 [Bacteroidales bacterium]|nr:hypothetical protein [Bacteroidales bacterium]